jgi:hypothetical protein
MAVDTTIVREAKFLEDERKKLLASASGLANKPITLPRQELAPFSSATQQAFDAVQTGLGAYQPYLASSEQALGRAQGITDVLGTRGPSRLEEARTAALAGAGDIIPRIGDFQNPYQTQVVDAFTAEANRQADIQRKRLSDEAVQRSAYGSSGDILRRSEFDRNAQDLVQRNLANLYSQGYQQSLGAAEREAARMQNLPGQLMGIEQLQYGLPLSVATQQGALSQAYGGLGSLAQQLPAQDIALLSQVGSQQQRQAQQALDLERQNVLQQTYEPYQRIGWQSDILKGQPSVQSTLTQSTDPRTNPLSQALGAGISLAGIFGTGGYGTGYLFQPGGAALAGAATQAAGGGRF